MNAILSVIGKDQVGILATVASECSKYNANVIEVSQTILNDYFAMIMIVAIDNINVEFNHFVDIVKEVGNLRELKIHVMHEDIFNSMHKI